jgi:hypothetical protein
MTFIPLLIQGTFEDVIVQKSPAAPLYFVHSFVMESDPLRGEDADTDATLTPAAAVSAAASTRNVFILSSSVVWNPLLVSSRPSLSSDCELNDCHDSCERHPGQFVGVPDNLCIRRAEPAKARFVGRNVERAEIRNVRVISRESS